MGHATTLYSTLQQFVGARSPGLELSNEFSVNMPIEVAWPMLLDVDSIVQCVPGGELLEKLDGRNFKGRVSVKLGPMLLTFEGIAKFIDIDETNRQAEIEARGTDKKGRGSAQAKVRLRLEPKGQSTNVLILTDMQLSGSVAQIGRASGLIEEVSRQLVGAFANNLNQRFGASTFGKPPPENSAIAEPAPVIATPISGFNLAVRTLCNVFARLFKTLTGRV
jgi:carbon monoxide dehydrogenase subunit G